jgi:hypothetical protein
VTAREQQLTAIHVIPAGKATNLVESAELLGSSSSSNSEQQLMAMLVIPAGKATNLVDSAESKETAPVATMNSS